MKKAAIIGGITTEIEGYPDAMLVYADSNPGKISMSYGGVGRNIVENLARMGAQVGFVSAAGEDFPGRAAVRELLDLGVDVNHVYLFPGENTAVYMSILNMVGDMELAMCNLDLLERINLDFIRQAATLFAESSVIGLDTNLTEETLEQVTTLLAGTPLFLDPVSTTKAQRAARVIGRFHTIKPNRMEAEVLTGRSIISPDDLNWAGDWFLDQGVKQVLITLGPAGVYFQDQNHRGVMNRELVLPSGSQGLVSATGAGDAFSAAILYGILEGMSLKEIARTGLAAASIAMESKQAVNPLMSGQLLLERVNSGSYHEKEASQ